MSVGAVSSLDVVRPDFGGDLASEMALVAVRNEVEGFQIVVRADAGPIDEVRVSVDGLDGLDGLDVTIYQVGLVELERASNADGDTGRWPDPLIPAVDNVFHEARNAFPFAVAGGEARSILIEVFVPPGTEAGVHGGIVTVDVDGAIEHVPVAVDVRDWDLPATSTLPTAFGMGWNNACVAHHGSYEACGYDAGIEEYHRLYAEFLLDHRLSAESVVYYGPDGSDWSRFDRVYGPLFDGTANTRLAGARMTSVRAMTDAGGFAAWSEHFADKGWSELLFDYTCDEPPNGCGWNEIAGRAANAHAAGIPTLVTTDADAIAQHDLSDSIDIMVPIANYVLPYDGPSTRSEYDSLLGDGKRLWWYQSCMSHGCGGTESEAAFRGWPSYAIDATGVQHRAMEWFTYQTDVHGELYFATDDHLATAWTDQWAYGGNGDGTLLYPGTPALIGGTHDIPIGSLRLSQIRDGLEDYEILAALEARSQEDGEFARGVAAGVFPSASRSIEVTPADLLAARIELLDRLAPSAVGPGDTDGPDETDAGGDSDREGAKTGCGCGDGSAGLLIPLLIGIGWIRRRR